jgi:ribonuclease Z
MIQRGEEIMLLDAGDGVQRQAIAMGIELNRMTTILITHLHADHVAGLFGILWTMTLNERTEPLAIIGPPPLRKWLDATCQPLRTGLGHAFSIKFVPVKRGVVLRLPAFNIRAERANHSLDSFSYVVEEKAGRRRRIGYSGDTMPSKALSHFFQNCDLLIFDSTYSTADKDMALRNKVSTSVEAATIASEAHAKELVLTHFSARYESAAVLVREARAVFPKVLAAHDGMRCEID